MCGVQAASKASEWVLCVDDDVCLHPRSLQDSIRAMQQDGAAFMLTGGLLLPPSPPFPTLTPHPILAKAKINSAQLRLTITS